MTLIPLESAEQIVRAYATIDFPWEKIIDEFRALAVGEVVGGELVHLSDVECVVRRLAPYSAGMIVACLNRLPSVGGGEAGAMRESLLELLENTYRYHFPPGSYERAYKALGMPVPTGKEAYAGFLESVKKKEAERSELAQLRASRERMRKALEEMATFVPFIERGDPYVRAQLPAWLSRYRAITKEQP